MSNTLYHKLLRISALTLAFVLLFQSGVVSPITRELSQNTSTYLATAIGINAAVLPNEINTLSAQLREREEELQAREIAVKLKEESVDKSSDISTFILSTILFILLVLIVLNYLLDFLRMKRGKLEQHEQTA